MSLRVGRQQHHSKGKRPLRPKKAATTKREWVSTVNDLSVHKLTPAELSHRHEIHKSHNKAAAQWELREKSLKRRLRHGGNPAPMDQASLSIIREVFSDQLLLQDVLARSDRAMAVVKDLFGDAPRRQTGHPSVTMAPNCDSDSELPVLQRPDPPTQLSLLSQSMMDHKALNELKASEEDLSNKDACSSGSSEYHVIRRANIRKMKPHSHVRVVQQQKDDHPNYHQADRDNVLVTPSTSVRAPDQTALNATVAVQRVRSRQSQSEEAWEKPSVLVSQVLNPDVPPNQSGKIPSQTNRTRKCVSQGSELDGSFVGSLNGDQSSLGLLQAMLGQVEADLDTLSPDTASVQSPKPHRTQGLTGFSVALVSILGRLVHLLKQKEEEDQNEAQERRRLEGELREQQGLIDALTAETMTLREEAATLQTLLQRQTTEMEQKLDTIVLLMGGLGLLEAQTQESDVKAAVCQSAPVVEQLPERMQSAVSPVVLLSPPRQRDNLLHIPMGHPVLSHQQLSPVDNYHTTIPQELKAHSSASSLTSLPLASLPSTSSLSLTSDPFSSQLSPEAVLSQQNYLIKAQRSQAQGLGSVVRVSPPGSSVEGKLSPCSTGGNTSQGVELQRSSGSSSTGSQNIEADRLVHREVSSNPLSVSSVEQRLLELNRQSAAARGRLLELIEQQKQSVLSKVSTSASPEPHSALSPHTPVGERSPEVSLMLPAQELLSQRGIGEKRPVGSEVSSLTFGGESRDGKTQTEKQRAWEGWFALSAHVR
ncbi:spindle and centriole-associated protein 1 isoform X1 [Channa argus]|uniref:spindle and centriole-associated protein 1 isoform X1 n=1 Tax=Channa argus TaxID=215402 RepID=UPI002945DE7B|nr:hypothetical protein Q8A73_020442 [Channa argus]